MFEAKDLPYCAQLVALARSEAVTIRGGSSLAGLASDPVELVNSWASSGGRLTTLLVGLFHGSLVGLAAGTIDPTSHEGRVEICYVEQAARGVGVGRALIEALLAWFKEQRCIVVDALALPGDRESKRLLEAAGFKTRLLVLRDELG